jgi:hypothetical protein
VPLFSLPCPLYCRLLLSSLTWSSDQRLVSIQIVKILFTQLSSEYFPQHTVLNIAILCVLVP